MSPGVPGRFKGRACLLLALSVFVYTTLSGVSIMRGPVRAGELPSVTTLDVCGHGLSGSSVQGMDGLTCGPLCAGCRLAALSRPLPTPPWAVASVEPLQPEKPPKA